MLLVLYGICFFATVATMYKVYALELSKTAAAESAENEYHQATEAEMASKEISETMV